MDPASSTTQHIIIAHRESGLQNKHMLIVSISMQELEMWPKQGAERPFCEPYTTM